MTAIAPHRTRRAPRRPSLVLAVPVIATVTAGLSLARNQPLLWDEAVTVAVASRPLPAIFGTVHHSDAVLGAYYLLAHAWSALLTPLGSLPAAWWWRLPSAVAAVATCVIVTSCARRLAGPVAALGVTSAWWVWTRPGAPRPLLHATVTVVLLAGAAWLQLFTVLVWPAFLLVAGRHAWRRGVILLAAATAVVAPLLRVALSQSSEIAWVPPATPANTVGVALHVGGGVAVVALVAAVVALAARAGVVPRTPMTCAVAWWACAPFTLLAGLDLVRPVLVARYALVSLPLVAVGFGVVIARARPGALLRLAGAATLTAAVVTSTWQNTRPWKYEDYRGAAAFAQGAVAAGTPVVFAPSSARLGFDVYAPPSLLHDLALPAGVGADPLAIPELTARPLRELISASCSIVVVGESPTANVKDLSSADRAKLAMVSDWSTEATRGFGQVRVTVMDNPACATRTSAQPVAMVRPVPDPDIPGPRATRRLHEAGRSSAEATAGCFVTPRPALESAVSADTVRRTSKYSPVAGKVPQITVVFWVIKVLTTGMGEATSDYLAGVDLVLAGATGVLGFALALWLQFRSDRYRPVVYWFAVMMVAVFGTMVADVVHVAGVPYIITTTVYALALAAVFTLWWRHEGTLSIHSITTRRRETWYWLTVLVTFALGTAAGDLTATTLHLGFFRSGVLFAAVMLIPLVGWRLGVNEVATFWTAYVITRPLGASFADWFGKEHSFGGGLGYGDGPVAAALLVAIVVLVGWVARREHLVQRASIATVQTEAVVTGPATH